MCCSFILCKAIYLEQKGEDTAWDELMSQAQSIFIRLCGEHQADMQDGRRLI